MQLDYFYGQQADMFSFYRIPKVLFTDERFWNVSTDAKLLYGILLDRMNLSAKNGWLDEAGRVYIIFTIDEIKSSLGCAEKKSVKMLDELEKKCGLIERKQQGLGKPNLIYVKNFVSTGVNKPVDNTVERQSLNCQKHKVIILIKIILNLVILIPSFLSKKAERRTKGEKNIGSIMIISLSNWSLTFSIRNIPMKEKCLIAFLN